MLPDNDVRIDTGRALDGGTFVSRLRAELEAELLAAGLTQYVEPDKP